MVLGRLRILACLVLAAVFVAAATEHTPTEHTPGATEHTPTEHTPGATTEGVVGHLLNETHDEEAELEHVIALDIIIPVSIAYILALVAANVLEHLGVSWFPESAATIIIGAALGFLLKYRLGEMDVFTDDDTFSEICAVFLNLFLLPMLIFESGFSLRTKDFASQFNYILLFACVGSLISFLVVAALIHGAFQIGLHNVGTLRVALAYASLIAATDPVATLATYSKLKVDALLNIMVFGDSTFNDAVAIVLFKVLNDDSIMGTRLSGNVEDACVGQLVLTILGGIAKIFTGSFLIGLGMAAFFLWILRFLLKAESAKMEILFLVFAAYVTFAVGEVLHMSGIIATIFCSIFMGIYARPHLSYSGSLLSTFYLKQVAHMMDTGVFLLTGLCVVNLDVTGLEFGLCAMLACLIGRAASVFPMGLIVNCRKKHKGQQMGLPKEDWHLLGGRDMFMMWHAGLRGAISLTLCMQLGHWVDAIDGAGTRKTLQTATFLLICVFLVVFGGSTEACLKALGVPMGENAPVDRLYKTELVGRSRKALQCVHENVFVPLFLGDPQMMADVYETNKDQDVEELLMDLGDKGDEASTYQKM